MESKNGGYVGNIERTIKLSKWDEISHLTAEKPVKIAEKDGAVLYTAKVGIIIDNNFPTKAGNTVTTAILVPLDGGKEFDFTGGKVKFDGINPFIYAGRGASHVFTTYADNGDIMKRNTSRKSAQKEIDALNAKMDTIMAALAAMAKK